MEATWRQKGRDFVGRNIIGGLRMDNQRNKFEATDNFGNKLTMWYSIEMTYDEMRLIFATLAAFFGVDINDLYENKED